MVDIFERLTYAPVSSAKTSGVPSIDFAAGREAARTNQTMINALDRLSSHAFKQSTRRNEIEGAAMGAQDPTATLRNLSGQNPADFNVGESAAYQAAIKGLGAEIEVKAREAMGKEYLESVELGETPDQLAERLDMAVVGFSESLALLSPEAAGAMQNQLDAYRNAQYLNFSEDHIKKVREENRAEGATLLATMSESLENLSRSAISDVDNKIEDGLLSMASFMETKGYSETEIATQIIKERKKANIARVRGGFDRLSTPAAKLQYADDLEKSLSKKGGLSRNLDDNTAQTLINNFRTMAKADRNALNGEIANLKSDAQTHVSNIVSVGGVPSAGALDDLRSRLSELEETGGDVEKIAEVKQILNRADENITYIKSIQTYNIADLAAEKTRLLAVRDEGATPDDILRLKVVSSRLSALAGDATSTNSAWKKSATALKSQINDLEGVVDKMRPIGDDALTVIGDTINSMREAGAPDALMADLDSEFAELQQRVTLFEKVRTANPDQIGDAVSAMSNAETFTPDTSAVLDILNTRLKATETGLAKDPLAWADSAGFVNIKRDFIEALLGGDPDDIQSFVSARVANANKVAGHYQNPKTILTSNEANTLTTMLNELPIDDLPMVLDKVVKAFGNDSITVMRQISKDAPELAHVGGMIVGGSSAKTIEAALLGRRIKQGSEVRDIGEFAEQRNIATKSLSGLQTNQVMVGVVENITTIADSIYLGLGGSLTDKGTRFNRDKYEDALDLAAGAVFMADGTVMGGLDQYNDGNVILPNNISKDGGLDDLFDAMETEQDFIKYAKIITPSGLESVASMPVGGANQQPITLSVIKKLKLITVGDGLYKLQNKNGATAMSVNGYAFVIDLKAMANAQ